MTADSDFAVDKLRPNTDYLVWATRRTTDGGWSPWSDASSVTTAAVSGAPEPPEPPDPRTALGCRQVALRLPARRVIGCSADDTIEVEMRTAGDGQEWREVQGDVSEDEMTITINDLDPMLAYEFRTVAYKSPLSHCRPCLLYTSPSPRD